MTTGPDGPLARFKVIDLTRVRAGPTAVRQLAEAKMAPVHIANAGHLPPLLRAPGARPVSLAA